MKHGIPPCPAGLPVELYGVFILLYAETLDRGAPVPSGGAQATLGMGIAKTRNVCNALMEAGACRLERGAIHIDAALEQSERMRAVSEARAKAGKTPKNPKIKNLFQEKNADKAIETTPTPQANDETNDVANDLNKNKNKKRKEPKEKNKNKNKIINIITKHARGENSGDSLDVFSANDPPTDAELVALFELYNESATRAGWQNCRMPPTKNRLEQMRSAVGWAGNVADFKAGLAIAEGLDFLKTKRGGMSVDFLIKGFTENNGVKYQPTIIRILEGGFANDKRYDNGRGQFPSHERGGGNGRGEGGGGMLGASKRLGQQIASARRECAPHERAELPARTD